MSKEYLVVAFEDGTSHKIPIETQTNFLLTISEKGFGKKTPFDNYRLESRARKGNWNFRISAKTGSVVKALAVNNNLDVIVITKSGQIIRIPVNQISECGRNTQGSKIINLPKGDLVQDIALAPDEESGEVWDPTGDEVMLITKNGLCSRFSTKEVSSTGRSSSGVTGIKLQDDDCVVSLVVIPGSECFNIIEAEV